jgi:phage gp36-like protein
VSYATAQDLVTRFGLDEISQLAPPDDPGAADFDAGRVESALNDAAATVDSYLRLRMPVPVSPVPDVLVGAATDLARFKLHDDHAPEAVKERYRATVQWLKDLAAGKASLGELDTAVTPAGRVVRREGASAFDWSTHVA